jgi:hypothetical protein
MPDNSSSKGQMTQSDASRIQSSQVCWKSDSIPSTDTRLQAQGGKDMSSEGFAARAQSAGDRNVNANSGNAAKAGQGGGQKK